MSVHDIRLATCLWILRGCIAAYVIFSWTVGMEIFKMVTPTVITEGWIDVGTLETGTGQTYTDENGAIRPFNVSDPHYCRGEFVKDYQYTVTLRPCVTNTT